MIQPSPIETTLASSEQLRFRVQRLEEEVSELKERGSGRNEYIYRLADIFTIVQATELVRKFTEELIPGKVTVDIYTFPDYGDQRIQIQVDVSGTVDEIVNYSELWQRGITKIVPEHSLFFVLMINPDE
ncbi:hypothetical protein ETAA8_66970 [Anatilimnocola aggregata]|uniref:Uncharacterized protein n=1 Tax=Anatilimnocola aggregata TaxID=2528021 RepID=A0A517YMT7_9BACT|nr:hypothetical protein [Anatilimnocola aggregata]QDU31538.1 hypothetical protein ETAA8_66970 [Anatilimnocola aggregata]